MRSSYHLIWQLTLGQRLRYLAAMLALIIASGLLYMVPLMPEMVIDGVIGETPEQASAISRWLISILGGREHLSQNLWMVALFMVLLAVLAGVFTYLRGRWTAIASENIVRKTRDGLFDQLMHLPVSYYDRAETGDLVQRCTSDVDTLRLFLAEHVVEIGRALVMLIAPLPLMLSMDPRMTLVAMLLIPPLVLFSFFYFRRVRRFFKDADEAEARMTSVVQENLSGIRVVRAFANQSFEIDKFRQASGNYRKLDYRMYRLMANYWSIADLLSLSQVALVVIFGGYWLAQGSLQVGSFYFFLSAVNLFIWPLRMLGRILTQLGKATVAIGRLDDILGHARETEAEHTNGLPPFRGELVFRDVSFSHGKGVAALDNVSFDIPPGQTLALLGPSGAGKTTIVNLLLRFYDPDSGSILIDGQDVLELGRKALRRQMAVVMQEPFLYAKSLRENIRLGLPQADDNAIRKVAMSACVHGTIESFEHGYDTLVGERGITLSGGQRQRVALARALLEEPALLILDDAFSAVDTETEKLILRALRQRHGRQTTILIAHRLSSLMHADQILVLDKGRVVQRGKHDELIARPGLYQEIWYMQANPEQHQPGAWCGGMDRDG